MGVSAGPDIVEDGLVLHLDAGNRRSYSGSGTTWTDLSQNNNNGTLVNSPTFLTGNLGSIQFDGANDYVTIPNVNGITSFGNTDDYSISIWVYPNSAQNFTLNPSVDIIAKWETSNAGNPYPYRFAFYAAYNLIQVTTYNGSDQNTGYVNITVEPNKWNHITVVFKWKSSQILGYCNGVLVDTNSSLNSTGIISNNSLVYIARRGDTNPSFQQWFTGRLNQLLIYNRALTQQEVSQNFNAIRGRYGI